MKKRLPQALLCLALVCLGALASRVLEQSAPPAATPVSFSPFSLEELPEYSGEPSVILNWNLPCFSEEDKTPNAFELYSPLDGLGRCGTAYANVGPETMPTGEREAIGMIRPSGWQLVKYDFVDGKYLYNRCHLIGYQLTGENANERNLVTGTRYLNTQGMLPYEDLIADYVHETGNHVLYRVSPIFDGDNLVCSGVEMEGWSVEDEGAGVCFHVYAYNVQPGVVIDYATGDNSPAPEQSAGQTPSPSPASGETPDYVLNLSSKRFHLPDCSGAASISASNRQDYFGSRQELIDQGYIPCGSCRP